MHKFFNLISPLAIYADKRVFSIFLLGILSGLPWVMIGSMLTLWLKEAGVSRTEIGYAGLIFAVFAINFLWSPLLDQFRPRLFPRLGLRRSWLAVCQFTIVLACLIISTLSPATGAKAVVLIALIIAIASATQDIAIDAYRVDMFDARQPELISAGAAAATAGWWTGYAGLGFVPLALSDLQWAWAGLYLVVGGLSLSLWLITFFSPDPPEVSLSARNQRYQDNLTLFSRVAPQRKLLLSGLMLLPLLLPVWAIIGSPGLAAGLSDSAAFVPLVVAAEVVLILSVITALSRIRRHSTAPARDSRPALDRIPAFLSATLIAPLEDFFRRNGVGFALALLAFVLLFKLGEAFLGRMSVVFYAEVGFTNTQIALYSKLVTWVVTVAAAIPCGLLNARLGLIRGLFISGVFMAGTNLLFSIIAVVGPDVNLYLVAVISDGFTQAWGSVAFVSFISMLCNHAFSATQYALLASLASAGRTTLASFSGQIVDGLDGNWAVFFIITTVMVAPGLALLLAMRRRLTQLYIAPSDPASPTEQANATDK